MTWTKLCDTFWSHPKVLAAGVCVGEARAWCEERVRVWRERRGAR